MPRHVPVLNKCKRLVVRTAEVRALFLYLDTLEAGKIPPGELSIAFLPDDEMARVHGSFLQEPTPTDVLTFPGNETHGHAGEICVSVDRAEYEAQHRGHTLARELTLYLVHGWLHLAGWDDHNLGDRRRMRKAEASIMGKLERAGKIPNFRLRKHIPYQIA